MNLFCNQENAICLSVLSKLKKNIYILIGLMGNKSPDIGSVVNFSP